MNQAPPKITSVPVISYLHEDDPWLKRQLINMLELAAGRRRIEAIYQRIKKERPTIPAFFQRAVDLGELKLQIDAGKLARVPESGPVVFVANHPFGVVDGVILCHLAARTRGAFKILVNARLCRDELLDPCFLPVSFEEGPEAVKLNVQSRRAARAILDNDGTLVIFPSGGIATRGMLGFGQLQELPWSSFAAKIIGQSRASVVPVYFHGQNSWPFHFVSAFSPTLRLALLLHEVGNKMGKEIRVDIGEPINSEQLLSIGDRHALTKFLYAKTFALPTAQ